MKPADANLAPSLPLDLSMPSARTRAADYIALTKPRLNSLVVATAGVGYYLGAGRFEGLPMLRAMVSTALVAGGASALNQLYERRTDGLMIRTRTRPLPDGRLSMSEAAVFGAMLSAAGLAALALEVNLVSALVALATLVTYLAVYTPLKLRTSLSTLVGAIPGALPVVIGWTAATGRVSIEAAALFAIVFLWQMPHFMAIAWMYRDDYERAGFPLLAVIEPDGRSTARQAVVYSAALVPVSLLPGVLGLVGPSYAAGALLLGGALFGVSLAFAASRSIIRARWLFVASIVYLPLLWMWLIASRV